MDTNKKPKVPNAETIAAMREANVMMAERRARTAGVTVTEMYRTLTMTLSSSQRRLLDAISREPTAHPYANEYMARYQLTRGGVASGLRRLTKFALVALENGMWQLQPPELRAWLDAVHKMGPEGDDLTHRL